MRETKNTWWTMGLVILIVVWVVVMVLVIVVPTRGKDIAGTYVSADGSKVVLGSNGSAVWTSQGTKVAGRYVIGADAISIRKPGQKALGFKRVDKNLKRGDEVYVLQTLNK